MVQGRLSPENSTARLRHRKVGETGRSGSHRPHSRATSVSGTWLKRETAGTLGELACPLNALGLLGLHVMGIICSWPPHADDVHRNATFLSFVDACVLKFKGFGQTWAKQKRCHRKALHPPAREGLVFFCLRFPHCK